MSYRGVLCTCRECRAGDALPARLQGIPNARQLTFIQGAKPMPTIEDRLKSACQDRCSDFGDPPCYEIVKDEPSLGEWTPCAECKADCGLPADPEPLDPGAVTRPLL